jgi:hypothetical protein
VRAYTSAIDWARHQIEVLPETRIDPGLRQHLLLWLRDYRRTVPNDPVAEADAASYFLALTELRRLETACHAWEAISPEQVKLQAQIDRCQKRVDALKRRVPRPSGPTRKHGPKGPEVFPRPPHSRSRNARPAGDTGEIQGVELDATDESSDDEESGA